MHQERDLTKEEIRKLESLEGNERYTYENYLEYVAKKKLKALGARDIWYLAGDVECNLMDTARQDQSPHKIIRLKGISSYIYNYIQELKIHNTLNDKKVNELRDDILLGIKDEKKEEMKDKIHKAFRRFIKNLLSNKELSPVSE